MCVRSSSLPFWRQISSAEKTDFDGGKKCAVIDLRSPATFTSSPHKRFFFPRKGKYKGCTQGTCFKACWERERKRDHARNNGAMLACPIRRGMIPRAFKFNLLSHNSPFLSLLRLLLFPLAARVRERELGNPNRDGEIKGILFLHRFLPRSLCGGYLPVPVLKTDRG